MKTIITSINSINTKTNFIKSISNPINLGGFNDVILWGLSNTYDTEKLKESSYYWFLETDQNGTVSIYECKILKIEESSGLSQLIWNNSKWSNIIVLEKGEWKYTNLNKSDFFSISGLDSNFKFQMSVIRDIDQKKIIFSVRIFLCGIIYEKI